VRYVYLGDRLTDPRWVGQPCDPVLRASGERMTVIRGNRPRNQLVRFADGSLVVVLGRRLRVTSATLIADLEQALEEDS
jgi:hypothetical protein